MGVVKQSITIKATVYFYTYTEIEDQYSKEDTKNHFL